MVISSVNIPSLIANHPSFYQLGGWWFQSEAVKSTASFVCYQLSIRIHKVFKKLGVDLKVNEKKE